MQSHICEQLHQMLMLDPGSISHLLRSRPKLNSFWTGMFSHISDVVNYTHLFTALFSEVLK